MWESRATPLRRKSAVVLSAAAALLPAIVEHDFLIAAKKFRSGSVKMLSDNARESLSQAVSRSRTSGSGERVVTKIVKLLESMQDQLEEDQKTDDDAQTKMECWCKRNNLEKTDAVKKLEADIKQYNLDITTNAAAAESAKLSLEELERDLLDSAKEVKEAEEQRDREHVENQKNILELTEAVGQINSAIVVLRNSGGAGTETAALMDLRRKLSAKTSTNGIVQGEIDRRLSTTVLAQAGSSSAESGSATLSFLRKKLSSLLSSSTTSSSVSRQVPAGASSVAGMLSEMATTFQQDLTDTQTKEAQAVTAYLELRQSRTEQAEHMREQRARKSEAMTAAYAGAADAKIALGEAEALLDNMDGFIAEARKTCLAADEAYQLRLKERTDEIRAVSQAVEILSSDEARDTFKKVHESRPVSFLQVLTSKTSITGSRSLSSRPAFVEKSSASSLLGSIAKTFPNDGDRISRLLEVGQEPFASQTSGRVDGVVARIQMLVQDLKSENYEEQIRKSNCQTSMHANELEDQRLSNEIEKTETEIALLEGGIEGLEKEKAETTEQMKETKENTEKATENQETEKKEFTEQIADQVAAQGIILKALNVLQAYYDRPQGAASSSAGVDEDHVADVVDANLENGTSFLTFKQDPAPVSPFAGGDHEQHAHRHGVLQLLENVRSESSRVQRQVEASLEESVKTYEKIIQENETTIQMLKSSLAETDAQIASKHKDFDTKKEEKKNLQGTHFALGDTMMNERKVCLPLLESFDRMQETRTREAEALTEAIAILRGADIDSGEFAETTLGG
ncbi:unnamed protein product [Amoebophrya sp. A25]|nr:unnamed protein product [Amoebophrya sp. A25]|eukprot:GSA25T00004516001.1